MADTLSREMLSLILQNQRRIMYELAQQAEGENTSARAAILHNQIKKCNEIESDLKLRGWGYHSNG